MRTNSAPAFIVTICPSCGLPWKRPPWKKDTAKCDECYVTGKRPGRTCAGYTNRSEKDEDKQERVQLKATLSKVKKSDAVK